MRAGILGESPHKLHPGGLSRNTGADQRGTALFLYGCSDVLHRSHVEPAGRSILAFGQGLSQSFGVYGSLSMRAAWVPPNRRWRMILNALVEKLKRRL
jgi:hypothetical protein